MLPEWVGCLGHPDLASSAGLRGEEDGGNWGMQLHREAGRADCFPVWFSFSLLLLGSAGRLKLLVCVWAAQACVLVCLHVCVCVCVCACAQLCGRTSVREASRGSSLSLPTNSGSDSAPTEVALESFLGLTGTEQKLQIGCTVSLTTPKRGWEREWWEPERRE